MKGGKGREVDKRGNNCEFNERGKWRDADKRGNNCELDERGGGVKKCE